MKFVLVFEWSYLRIYLKFYWVLYINFLVEIVILHWRPKLIQYYKSFLEWIFYCFFSFLVFKFLVLHLLVLWPLTTLWNLKWDHCLNLRESLNRLIIGLKLKMGEAVQLFVPRIHLQEQGRRDFMKDYKWLLKKTRRNSPFWNFHKLARGSQLHDNLARG